MYVKDGILYFYPICGGETPPEKSTPPEQIVTSEFASVFIPESNAYEDWVLSAYRPFLEVRPINFAGGGVSSLITAFPGVVPVVQYISFTVDAETDITLYVGGVPISGPMDFGGDGEPRGISMTFPYPGFRIGGAFNIGSSDAVQVSGLFAFYLF